VELLRLVGHTLVELAIFPAILNLRRLSPGVGVLHQVQGKCRIAKERDVPF
jgi:hypothetical protein